MNESSLILIFGTSFIVALSGAMMPGPLLAITISRTAERGFWAGPLLILGHGLLEIVLVVALAHGLSDFVGSSLFSGIIGLIGGAVLTIMGFVTTIQGRHKTLLAISDTHRSSGTGTLVLSGVIASLSNPYWLIWWATLGVTYMLWSLQRGIPGVISFYSGHILADFAWYSLISLIIATGRKILSDAIYRGLLVTCGLALLALGIYFIISGIQLLSG